MPKLRQKRASEYLQFHPYRAIVAPKLRPQSERDQLADGGRKQNRISISPKAIRSRIRIGVLIVAVLLIVLAASVWMTLSRLR